MTTTIEERQHDIASRVAESGSITVEQIVDSYGVSPATARRDLDALADQLIVIRTRGGARAAAISGDIPLRYRAATLGEEKIRIAAAVADMIQPGHVVAFNGGTTTTQCAQEFGVRVAANADFQTWATTVVTNAINIASDLIIRPELRVVLTGGVARMRSYELVGPLAKAGLAYINADFFFFGVNGIDPARGFFSDDDSEAEISAAILDRATSSWVVADHTKFGARAFALVCGIDAVDGVITDSKTDPEMVEALRAQGCQVIVV